MELYNLINKNLSQIVYQPFYHEKDIQRIAEENTKELFNLDFVTDVKTEI